MIRGMRSQRVIVCLLGFVLICGLVGVVSAAAEPAAPAATSGYLQYQDPAAKPAGTAWGTVAYVFSLIFLFIGVIFLAYMTSRFLAVKMGGMGHGAGSAIHTTLALGPNRNIHLVEMAGRFFVVGATEHSIQLLFEIDSPEQIAKIRETAQTASPSFETALGGQILALKQIRERFPGIFSPSGSIQNNDDQEKR
jgi:flagellar protein FliO/FliZ